MLAMVSMKALEYYHQAIEFNPCLPLSIEQYCCDLPLPGEKAKEDGESDASEALLTKAAEY
jgi:hypothetical protein